jgi:hypothetical protein
MVDTNGNDCEAQYISHFDQIKAGFKMMVDHLTNEYVGNPGFPEIYVLAANYNTLRASEFDAVEVFSMLTVAMHQLASIKAAERTSARHGNPMREGRN